MQKPQGRPITDKEAEVMIDRYQSGNIHFKPGKEKGCINSVAFDTKALVKFLLDNINGQTRIVPAAHEDGVPTFVIQNYNLDQRDNQVSSFNDGLTCPPFPVEVCNPG